LIGGFDALARWHPAVAKSETVDEGGKRRRRLSLQGGGEVVEEQVRQDDNTHAYSYTIVSGPLPVAGYRAEISVRDDGTKGCTVRWSSSFEPKGASETAATDAIRGVYQAGFDALKRQFGG